jgi:hypothetical protein
MTEKRIHVWIQPFKDRPFPLLQWIDPDSGKRKSQSARTTDPRAVETARANLETNLNNTGERLLKKRCDRCGKPFEPLRSSARFCSPKCRAYWNRWSHR